MYLRSEIIVICHIQNSPLPALALRCLFASLALLCFGHRLEFAGFDHAVQFSVVFSDLGIAAKWEPSFA